MSQKNFVTIKNKKTDLQCPVTLTGNKSINMNFFGIKKKFNFSDNQLVIGHPVNILARCTWN